MLMKNESSESHNHQLSSQTPSQPETQPSPGSVPSETVAGPHVNAVPAVGGSLSGRPAVPRLIKLVDIRCDAGTQIRAEINEEAVAEYSERMLAHDQFPPIDVVYDAKEYFLVDGFHRVQAAQRAGITSFQCNVYPGTLNDAVWFALGANSKNGLRRGAADKHRAIELALSKFPEKTQQQIAERVGCTQQYVAKVQSQLTTSCKLALPSQRKGKDGRSRPAKYKSRKTKKTHSSEPMHMPAPTPAPTITPSSLPPASPSETSRDFVAVVQTSFRRWMEQWAACDLPKIRKVLRDMLQE